MTVGDSFSGIIDFPGDEDWVAVDLLAGQPVRIEVLGWRNGEGTLRRASRSTIRLVVKLAPSITALTV